MTAVAATGPMLPWIATCVAAARAFGLDVLDGIHGDLRDMDGFQAECEQGRDLGTDGQALIHPKQVEVCNEVFTPTQEEIDWLGRGRRTRN